MSIKLLTPLSALVYFGFLYSFTESAFSQTEYVEEVLSNELNELINPICNVPYEKWAGICTYYITKIRSDYNIYEEMRVSYTAFLSVQSDEICQKKNLRLFEPLPNDTIYVEQYMMNCFCRQAIVPAGTSFREYEYYREIAIYPKDENTVMVFQYSKEFQDFMLFEKYQDHYWLAIPEIAHPSLLIIPPPEVTNDLKEVYQKLTNEVKYLEDASNDRTNVLNAIEVRDNRKLKIMILKYSSLAKNIIPLSENSKEYEIRGKVRAVLRLDFKKSKEFPIYTSNCSVFNKTSGKETYDVKLSGGPDKHSVLFLKKTNHNNKYAFRILDIFENLYPEFISYYL